jgi:hypothetical protein
MYPESNTLPKQPYPPAALRRGWLILNGKRGNKEAYIMAEISIAVTMLDELRPRLWKRIVLTLILTGMAHGPFEGLFFGSAVMAEDLVMGIVGLIAVILIWVDYYFRKNIYRKYQDELIKMTAIK